MNRLITYSMAATVGLLIAFALAWPSVRMAAAGMAAGQAHPGEAAASDTPAVRVIPEGGAEAPPAPVDNQTMLSTQLSLGFAVVRLNGQTVGSLQGGTQTDVSGFVHPGENTMRVMWVGPVSGDLRLTHAAQAGQFRDVGNLFLVPASTQSAGERTVTFYL